MKFLRAESLITVVVLATVLGTVSASVSAGTGPHFVWKATGPNTTDTYDSGVTYGDGKVFIGYCTESGVGFAAYDAETGAVRWNNTNLLDQNFACNYPPLYHSGTVYAIGSYSAVAFDASTGAVLWTQRNRLNNGDGLIVFDSVNGNIVFLGIGFLVSALDASTGTIRWQHKLSGWETAGSPTSLAIAHKHVYVPSANGTVAALRADTGALDWAVNVTTEGKLGPLATVCGVLVVSEWSYSKVYGLDPATGATRWAVNIDTNLQPPVVDKCTAYFTTLNGAAAIEVLSGTVMWQATRSNASYSMPAVAGGRFWEVSYQSTQEEPAAVVTRNTTTGMPTGTLPLSFWVGIGFASRVTATSPDGSMFFFALSDLTLYAVSAPTALV